MSNDSLTFVTTARFELNDRTEMWEGNVQKDEGSNNDLEARSFSPSANILGPAFQISPNQNH